MTHNLARVAILPAIVFTVVIIPRGAGALPEEAVQSIVDENYGKALTEINKLPEDSEKLFGRAFVTLRQKKYDRASKLFRRITRDYPDSPRAKDALYYRNLIKIDRGNPRPPLVAVQVALDNRIEGTLTGSAVVRSSDGNTIARLRSGDKWAVASVEREGLRYSTSGEFSGSDSAESITIASVSGGGKSTKLVHDGVRYRGQFKFRSSSGDAVLLINELPVRQYLYGVIRKEIAPNWPIEAVKAQAVAARSFVVSRLRDTNGFFDIKSSNLSQVYGGYEAETPLIRRAVDQTAGEVLTYKGNVVQAYYHANSGGYIETAKNVWKGTQTPYIVQKPDTWSKGTDHSKWAATLTLKEITESLKSSTLPPPAETPNLAIEKRLASNRVKRISYLDEKGSRVTANANDFRMAVGPNSLKSSWFTSLNETSTKVTFRGKGWGHGVGLSQWGAKAMAKEGMSYRAILSFYYPKTRLMTRYGLGSFRGASSEFVPNE